MPHIIIEYSANIEKHVEPEALMQDMHAAARDSEDFAADSIRTRLEPRSLFIADDGGDDNAFVAIEVRMGPGKNDETRRRIAQTLFDAANKILAPAREILKIQLSLELRESSNVRLRDHKPDGRA